MIEQLGRKHADLALVSFLKGSGKALFFGQNAFSTVGDTATLTHSKLEGVAPLITNTPLTSFTSLKVNNKILDGVAPLIADPYQCSSTNRQNPHLQ